MTRALRNWIAALIAMAGLFAVTAVVAGAMHFSGWSEPVNLGPSVNGTAVDNCPSVARDGLSLFFVSNRPGGLGGVDVWVAQRATTDAAWDAPVWVPGVNSSANDACPYVSTDGHQLLFASDRGASPGAFDLYIAHRKDARDDFSWEPPQPLTALNTESVETRPWAFENELTGGSTLLFASTRSGGAGGFDIYQSEWSDDGTFSTPVLVPGISTRFNESLPSVRRDGLELFFTSENRPGGAGVDLWTASRASQVDPWSTPVNLSGVNSVATDQSPAISWDGETLIFQSNRVGGLGSTDLWQVTREKFTGKSPNH